MSKTYTHKGFADFSRGTMGNGGQNLYVSRKGVLQRIFNFDTTNNGYFDIMITNSHDYSEKPPLSLISDPTGPNPIERKVLTDGYPAVVVADINNDGYDDLIVGSRYDGHHWDLAAFVYYGGPEGITENHKIELATPGCLSAAAGDYNGDGLCDLAFALREKVLRIYTQSAEGFLRDNFVDIPMDLAYITSADIDGDGYADLYCRATDGEWFILWGSEKGFDPERRTVIGPPTDDKYLNTLPFGGGNSSYAERTLPKILTLDGQMWLTYNTKENFLLYSICPGERRISTVRIIPLPGVVTAASGDVNGDGRDELALICRPENGPEQLIILPGDTDKDNLSLDEAIIREVSNPRDVLICDFNGNGYGDVAVCQGRGQTKYTSESLLFASDASGLASEPRRFVTHDATAVHAARTTNGLPELIFVNRMESDTYGHVPAYIFTGDADGWDPERRVELPGHSPGSILPADFDDDGFVDVLLINDGEDQRFLLPPSYIYHGSATGLDPARRTAVPSHLSWGAQVGDVNRDGYLDIIFTSSAGRTKYNRNMFTVFYGSENGYSLDNTQTIELAPGDEDSYSLLWGCLADLNGNGWLDFVVPVSAKSYSLIFWGGPEGYSIERSQKLPIEKALTVRAADLNNNGYLDLVFGTRASTLRNVGHSGSVVIFWGGPNGYSVSRCCELPSYQCNNITIADLNNDGYLDIFVSSYFNSRERDVNSFIYWNDKGNFSVTNRKRIFSHSSSASLACDLNEDGYVDLIVAGHRAYGSHRTEVAIWWNGPEGFSEERRSYLPCLGPHDMVGVDIGNQYDRGPEEYYISPPVELAEGEQITKIGWVADVPRKTWVHATLRAADSLTELENTGFVGPDGTDQSYYENGDSVTNLTGRYVQYRLAIGAINNIGTPRITEVYLEA